MYDVIECYALASPRRQVRQIVGQNPKADEACVYADNLSKESTGLAGAPSTFVVVDRTTAREIYRVPAD